MIAPDLDPRLEPAVVAAFPDANYKITPSQFLISAVKLTTNQVAERIGASGGDVGRVLVARLASYTGWHDGDMWEWLAAQSLPGSSTPFDPSQSANE